MRSNETDITQTRVTYEVIKGIARVRLNRPEKHNALDMQMFFEIDQTIRKLKKDRNIRVIIVSGEGDSFCSGLDIKSVMTNQKNGFRLLWKWWPKQANLAQRVTVGWRRLNVPVIMVLHGKCWGGGMQIALGGDFRIAAPETSLAVMEARWGLIPDMGGTLALRENVPLDRAMQLAMLGEPISAKEALDYNLITNINSNPMEAALVLAEQLKQRSPDSCRAVKKFYQQSWAKNEGRVLAGETINQWKVLLGKNQKIAVKKQLGNTEVEYLK